MKNNLKQYFPIDEWIYIKIYCNELLQEEILLNSIRPINNQIINDIDKWFFLRYNDTDNHIRLRYKLKDSQNNFNLIVLLKKHLMSQLASNKIWNIQFESYKPESERYGFTSYNITESLFYLNSDFFINNLMDLDENDRMLFNIWSAYSLLNIFYDSEKEIMNFIRSSDLKFKSEFNVSKNLKGQLSRKYRDNRETIEKLLSNNIYENFANIQNAFDCYNQRILDTANSINILDSDKKLNFIWGHLHMNTNRLFQNNQRLYEMISYDFLYRYYNSYLKRTFQ